VPTRFAEVFKRATSILSGSRKSYIPNVVPDGNDFLANIEAEIQAAEEHERKRIEAIVTAKVRELMREKFGLPYRFPLPEYVY